jgi:hypothetical protein
MLASVRLLPARAPVRNLPEQPDDNKRLRAAAPLLAAAITHLAKVCTAPIFGRSSSGSATLCGGAHDTTAAVGHSRANRLP